ncbi:MAG: hypothetical protein AAFX52_09500, partial [Pseudomonadota bacterium]
SVTNKEVEDKKCSDEKVNYSTRRNSQYKVKKINRKSENTICNNDNNKCASIRRLNNNDDFSSSTFFFTESIDWLFSAFEPNKGSTFSRLILEDDTLFYTVHLFSFSRFSIFMNSRQKIMIVPETRIQRIIYYDKIEDLLIHGKEVDDFRKDKGSDLFLSVKPTTIRTKEAVLPIRKDKLFGLVDSKDLSTCRLGQAHERQTLVEFGPGDSTLPPISVGCFARYKGTETLTTGSSSQMCEMNDRTQSLYAMASALERNQKDLKIAVIRGKATPPGGAEQNYQLANERVTSVMTALDKLVDSSKAATAIIPVSYGEFPAEPSVIEGVSNRRVELWFCDAVSDETVTDEQPSNENGMTG